MPETPTPLPSLTKLGKLANGRKFEALEAAWLPVVESEQYDPADLIRIAGQVHRLGETGLAESLAWTLLSNTEEKHGAAAALELGRQVGAQLPDSDNLRRELSRLYLSVHADYPGMEPLLERVLGEQLPLDETSAALDRYLQLRPGTFVADPNFLTPGIVEEIDPSSGVLTVRFDQRRQEYGRLTLTKMIPLPPDHFGALVLYDPDQLRGLAAEQPIDFVLLALKSAKGGKVGYRDLKTQVTRLLGEKGWQAWWKGIRPALKREAKIDLSSGSQPTLRLLQRGRSYEERLRREFDSLADPAARLVKVLSYLDETAVSTTTKRPDGGEGEAAPAADPDLLVHLGNSAAKQAVASLASDPALSLACLAVHAEVAARGAAVARPNPAAAAKVLARIEDPVLLADNLPEALLLRTLQYVRTNLPDQWPAVWARTILRAGRRTCDLLARGLVAAGHAGELRAVLDQILARPTGSPQALCWLWRARSASGRGETQAELAAIPAAPILAGLLNLADATGKLVAVSGEDRHRKTQEMVQLTIALQAGQPVAEVFAAATATEAGRFKEQIDSNSGLAASGRGLLLGLLRGRHAELFAEDGKPWEEDLIYTTERGLARRQTELNEILRVDIPAVAKQIGEAAAFGDLSENAEFTAALEKRDQLASRATNMENELKSARVITTEMADSGFVNIGCRVTVRNLGTGREESYTFLGPWDADVERKVITYNAPLALAFMGRKVGEEVSFGEDEDNRRWEVLAIEPAI